MKNCLNNCTNDCKDKLIHASAKIYHIINMIAGLHQVVRLYEYQNDIDGIKVDETIVDMIAGLHQIVQDGIPGIKIDETFVKAFVESSFEKIMQSVDALLPDEKWVKQENPYLHRMLHEALGSTKDIFDKYLEKASDEDSDSCCDEHSDEVNQSWHIYH